MSLSFPVTPSKADDLARRMAVLGLEEAHLEETFYRAGGKGGQKANKTSSGVILVHKPTGVQIRCHRERGQALNRFLARRLLVEELEARARGRTRHTEKAARLRSDKKRKERRQGEKRGYYETVYGQFIVREWPIRERDSGL